VATIAEGESVTIDTLGGTVRFAPSNTCTGTCICSTGPGGIPASVWDDPGNQLLCYNGDYCNSDPVTGANHAGLFYRVGSSEPALVGSGGTSWSMSPAGQLILGINDCSASNNTGSFSARVTITP
jgi:hypothetical protein